MARGTPQQTSEKWANNLSGAGAAIEAGVNRVREAPGQKAAMQQDKMRQNLLAAIDNGKWARNVSAVTLSDWQSAMKNKGIPNIQRGVTTAKPKMTQFFERLFPIQDQIVQELDSMPSTTLEENIQRAIHVMRRTSEAFRQG